MGLFVQASAVPSLLELCQAQPKITTASRNFSALISEGALQRFSKKQEEPTAEFPVSVLVKIC